MNTFCLQFCFYFNKLQCLHSIDLLLFHFIPVCLSESFNFHIRSYNSNLPVWILSKQWCFMNWSEQFICFPNADGFSDVLWHSSRELCLVWLETAKYIYTFIPLSLLSHCSLESGSWNYTSYNNCLFGGSVIYTDQE